MNKSQDHRLKKQTIAKSIYYNIPEKFIKKIYALGFLNMDHSHSKDKASTLVDRVSLLGSNPLHFNPKEWNITGAEHCIETSACVCGQQGIKQRYVLTNPKTKISISIGGSCLKKHFGITPETELLDFSKNFSEPYVWLGRKYDTFIFSVLGFKKAYLYFRCRSRKENAPREDNQRLKESLSKSIYAFNFPQWRKRFTRAENLFKRLQRKKTIERIQGTKIDPGINYTKESSLSEFINTLRAQNEKSEELLEKKNILLKTAQYEKMTVLITEGGKYKIFSKKVFQKYGFHRELKLAMMLAKRLRKSINRAKNEENKKNKEEQPKSKADTKAEKSAKWLELIFRATEDRISHPKGSDFYIMGHFAKEKRKNSPLISDMELMDLAKKHLAVVRETEDQEMLKELSRFSNWEMRLEWVSKDNELGEISDLAKRILAEYDKKAMGYQPKQRVLYMLSLLNIERKHLGRENSADKLLNEGMTRLIESVQKMIFDRNDWLAEYIKNK